MTDPFELPLTVVPGDIDVLGHVNNVVYVRWVQDAAVAHWRALTSHLQQEGLAWVVVRHEIDYKRAAHAGDRLIARTWVGPASRNTFERHTEIVRADDRKLVVKARTFWVPVDSRTGRPTSVPDDVRSLVSDENGGAKPI
ncbi:MAG: acyl-CoA thioesterase [Gemmatimonadales bacterium]